MTRLKTIGEILKPVKIYPYVEMTRLKTIGEILKPVKIYPYVEMTKDFSLRRNDKRFLLTSK
jgi:hypothetical protein